ncbi:relaxase/mobilization nuclease domain-containing protein [Paraburkholderia sp. GAS42]|uniref:relaxase/mobilization nuclease domain-containing protein n=1 Tax=Paraburkholderia sp. GAS42 TaxID=3035135 RepID=UPI003D201E30
MSHSIRGSDIGGGATLPCRVAALHDLTDAWQLGGWGIPEESHRREVFNVLLSMPPGTDRQAVRDAAREFAALEFGDGRGYVFAAHNDEAHPHVHLSVQVRGVDGRRLNPRKKDLQRWRERFAEQLRAQGVDANATSRRTRGATHRYPKQAVVHMVARGEMPRYWRASVNGVQRREGLEAHAGVFSAWRELAQAMATSSAPADRRMAVGITDFVRTMPVQQDGRDVGRSPELARAPDDERIRDIGRDRAAGRGTAPARDLGDAGRKPDVER